MVRMFDRIHWFLVTTRHSDIGAENRSVRETMGFYWNGPLTVMRLERRGSNTPAGIISSEYHQAATAAVERYVTHSIKVPPKEPSFIREPQLPGSHVGGT